MKEGEKMAATTEKLENGQGAGKIVEDVRKIEPREVANQCTRASATRLFAFCYSDRSRLPDYMEPNPS